MMDHNWEKIFVDTWNEIAIFEEHERKAWTSTNPLLTEARECARMEAYVKLAEKLADKSEQYLTRTDGRIEWLCEHGVGHTVDAPKKYKKEVGKYWNVHGCDGCCGDRKR